MKFKVLKGQVKHFGRIYNEGEVIKHDEKKYQELIKNPVVRKLAIRQRCSWLKKTSN